jgi:hypothetical protein
MEECPVCQKAFPTDSDGNPTLTDAHVNSCIDSLSKVDNDFKTAISSHGKEKSQMQPSADDECPVCHTDFMTKEFIANDAAREAHISTCFEMVASSSSAKPSEKPSAYAPPTSTKPSAYAPPTDPHPSTLRGKAPKEKMGASLSSQASGSGSTSRPLLQEQEDSKYHSTNYELLLQY